MKEIAKLAEKLPKESGSRMVVFTQGCNPVIVVQNGKHGWQEQRVLQNVVPLECGMLLLKNSIVSTCRRNHGIPGGENPQGADH